MGCSFNSGGNLRTAGRKITKMIHADGPRIFERAELHLVVIPRVQQCYGTALVQPLLQIPGGELGRCPLRRINAGDTERNDFLFETHQHPSERLVFRFTHLGLQIRQRWPASQLGEQEIDFLLRARDEQVDAFRAEQNRAFQLPAFAQGQQSRPEHPQVGQRNKLVCRDIDNLLHRTRRIIRQVAPDTSVGKSRSSALRLPEKVEKRPPVAEFVHFFPFSL